MSDSRYTLIKRIARGGMAEIWLGKQLGQDGFERICAIKKILSHYATDADFVEMFRDEAHICKSLQHANIVRVEGFEEVEGTPAIIMEFVDGADLRSLLHTCERSGHRLTIPMIIYIIAETSRGLHYAHTKHSEINNRPLGIVHRDVSPQNILISFEGEIKITDFGIADSEAKMTETKPGIVKGKYSYMSPEQISGKPVDALTDVFALSIILWECLAMQRLFAGENEVQTINLVRNCQISESLCQLNPDISKELEAIVLKGLAKDKRDRYQSAEELERALRLFLNKHHHDFSPGELGKLLKDLLAKKRSENIAEVKKALTSPNLKARTGSNLNKVNSSLSYANKIPAPSPAGSGHQTGIRPAIAVNTSASQAGTGLSRVNFSTQSYRYLKLPSTNKARNSLKKNYRNSGVQEVGKKRFNVIAFLTQTLIMALATAGIFMGYQHYQQQYASLGPASLTLKTSPAGVKLTLDNEVLQNGQYLESPVELKNLSPGSHVLFLERDGYTKLKMSFKVNRGGKLTSFKALRAKDGLSTLIVKAKNPSTDKLLMQIEQNRNKGYLPMTIPDLVPGSEYQVSFSSFAYVPNYNKFTCKLKIPSKSQGKKIESQTWLIDSKKKTCEWK